MTAPYGEYFGLAAIGVRMGLNPRTVSEWHAKRAFPLYARYSRTHRRAVWYTNDALILAWEQTQTERDRTDSLSSGRHVRIHGLTLKGRVRQGKEGMARSTPDAPPTPSSPPRNVR